MEIPGEPRVRPEQKCGSCVGWMHLFSKVLLRFFVGPIDIVRSVTSGVSPGLRLDCSRSSRFARLLIAERTRRRRSFRLYFCVSRRSRVLGVSWSSRAAAVLFLVRRLLVPFVRSGRTIPVVFAFLHVRSTFIAPVARWPALPPYHSSSALGPPITPPSRSL